MLRAGERRGRPCLGLLPDISRTKLAEALGFHKSQIANILLGQTVCPKELLPQMAGWLEIGETELDRLLKERRMAYLERKLLQMQVGETDDNERTDAASNGDTDTDESKD